MISLKKKGVLVNINNLPSVNSKELDFHLSLGIFGSLLASNSNDEMTIEQAYEFFLKSTQKNGSFICLEKNSQPNGVILWTKLNNFRLNSLKKINTLSIRDKIKLLDYYSDEGEPVILHMMSPFDGGELTISTWLSHFGLNKNFCWLFSEEGNIIKVEELFNE